MSSFRLFSSLRLLRPLNNAATSAIGTFLAVGGVLCAASPASAAASTYRVTVQTGSLSGLGVFGLDFLLQNGEAENPLQATVQNFRMVGGTWAGSGGPTAGSEPVVGNLASSLLLATTNGGDFSEFTQNFNVSSSTASITFDVILSALGTQASSADPDFFSFSILDNTSTPLATNSPTDGTSLVLAEFTRPNPQVQTFSAASPRVTVQAAAAPEPNTGSMLSWPAGIYGAAFWFKTRQRRKAVLCTAR